jgi:hypothetical protein
MRVAAVLRPFAGATLMASVLIAWRRRPGKHARADDGRPRGPVVVDAAHLVLDVSPLFTGGLIASDAYRGRRARRRAGRDLDGRRAARLDVLRAFQCE